jgi:hypothetical protein
MDRGRKHIDRAGDGQESPKHRQSKRVDRVRQSTWTGQKGGQGSPKHVDRAKGWTGFTKTCRAKEKGRQGSQKRGHSKRVDTDRVRIHMDIIGDVQGSQTNGQSR